MTEGSPFKSNNLRRGLIFLSGLALLGLGACSLGPNFKEPGLSPGLSWRKGSGPGHPGKAVPSQTVTAPVDPNWWAAFNDPELSALENRVAASNLDIRLATIRLAESREQRRISSASEFPQVQGSGSYDRVRLSPRGEFGLISGGGGGSASATSSANSGLPASDLGSLSSSLGQPFNLYQYGFDASWELDLWGRVRRQIEAADAQMDASAEDRRNTLISMFAEVARDYIQLRNVQSQLAIARENETVSRDSLKLAQQRYQGGLTSELDVNDASAQLANVVAAIPQLQQRESQAINQLSFLLGENPGGLSAELRQAKPVPPVPPRVPVGLPSELARRRPDIRMAEAQLHAATAQIGVATANFYPSVTLSGNLSIQAIRFTNLGNWDSRTYTFGPNITLPIFEGGKLKAQLELTKVQQKEAAVNFQRVVLNAFHEVDNSMVAYDAEQRRQQQLQDAVAQNHRALELARERYRQGLTDFLQVLDAQRQLLAAEQQLQDSSATISTNLVSLYLALGGGWETEYPVAPLKS